MPAKNIDPIKKNKEPIIAKIKVGLFSLNKMGTNKKEMPIKKKSNIDKLKKIEDIILSSPEWDSNPPKSLKKLWVNEYPDWAVSWIFPPG